MESVDRLSVDSRAVSAISCCVSPGAEIVLQVTLWGRNNVRVSDQCFMDTNVTNPPFVVVVGFGDISDLLRPSCFFLFVLFFVLFESFV